MLAIDEPSMSTHGPIFVIGRLIDLNKKKTLWLQHGIVNKLSITQRFIPKHFV